MAACLVAVKQIMPDNEVVLLGFIRFRAKVCRSCPKCPASPAAMHAVSNSRVWAQHLPGIFILMAACGSTALGTSLNTIPFVCFGTYAAWVYLRFLQYNSELSVW